MVTKYFYEFMLGLTLDELLSHPLNGCSAKHHGTGDITSSTRPNSLEKDLTHLSSVHFTYVPIKTRDVGLTLKPLSSKKLRRK